MDNFDSLTDKELTAIVKLQKLAKTWPQTLTLASMGGSLVIVRTGDPRFDADGTVERNQSTIDYIDGIPNTGGDW